MRRLLGCVGAAALVACGGGDGSGTTPAGDVPREDPAAVPVAARDAAVLASVAPARRPGLHAWKGVVALAATRDGSLLAAATAAGQVELLDPASAQPRATLAQASGIARTALAFSPDGSRLVVAGRDSNAQVWDVKGQRRIATLRGLQQPIRSLDVSPDGGLVASAGEDTRVLLWSTASGRVVRALEGHADFVNVVAFSPDGRRLASGDALGRVLVWDVASGRPVQNLRGHAGEVQTLAFSRDGQVLATAGDDARVLLWDAASGRQVGVLAGHQGRVRSLAFSADGLRLASAGEDAVVMLWDTRRWELQDSIPRGAGAVNALAFDRRHADVLFAAAEDAQVHRIALPAGGER